MIHCIELPIFSFIIISNMSKINCNAAMITKAVFIIFLHSLFSILPVSIFAQSDMASKAGYGKKPVPLIKLSGDSYSRGLQHGQLLKKEITEVFARWKASLRTSVKADPDSLLSEFLKATDFEPAANKYTPGIMNELKGIAEGSGQTYQDVFAYQLIDELWVYLDKHFNNNKHHCSGIGVAATAGHPAYIAQNMDLENYDHGSQVLLNLAPYNNEPEQFILSSAGLVALNGMNANGIGLCVNTLMELNASTNGLPVAFMVRAVLAKQDGAEAISFLQNTPHASGQNYILGVGDSVYCFEASASQVVRFIPKEGAGKIIYHTNHAIVNHDVKEWHKSYHDKVMAGEKKGDNSVVRLASLQTRLGKLPENINPELIKSTLRSKDDSKHPVCRPYTEGGRGFTFSSVLFTLGGKKSVELTNGSPDQSEYSIYYFGNSEKAVIKKNISVGLEEVSD